jgi:soluble lytic murein transglycosylase-like protein
MKMRLLLASALLVLSPLAPALAKHHKASEQPQREPAAHPDTFDEWIAKQAKIHGVPEALIHRVVMRESRYRPDAMHRIYFGLMQITYATARSMGYQGAPKGLLDAKTNLTYGVPYLANAYIVAENDPDRAVALYSKGYYFEAKRKHKLALLRTASSDPVIVEETVVAEAAPEPPANPVAQLFQALASPAPSPAPQQIADTGAEMIPVEADVPLPPRRPNL